MIKRIWPDIEYPTPHNAIDRILIDVASRHDIPPFRLKQKTRELDVVRARREFCREVYPGFTLSCIADFLNRDASTIHHLIHNDN